MNSYPTWNREFLKNCKKQKKIKNKKHHYGYFSSQKKVENSFEREKIKKIVLMSSYQTRNREFEKNSKKIEKIKKTPIWLLFKPK